MRPAVTLLRQGHCLVLLLALAGALTGCRDEAPDRRPETSRVTSLELSGTPVAVEDVRGRAWVALKEGRRIWRGTDERVTDLEDRPLDLVDTPHGVWVSLESEDLVDGYLQRLDRRTGAPDLRVALTDDDTQPSSLAYDGTTLWVVDARRSSVIAVDPSTGAVGPRAVVNFLPDRIESGGAGTFVTSADLDTVSGVRLRSGAARTYAVATAVCNRPHGLSVDVSAVWVACPSGDTVRRIYPQEAYYDVDLELPAAAQVVRAGARILAVQEDPAEVSLIEGSTGKVVRAIRLGDAARPVRAHVGAAMVGDDLVVVHPGADLLWRVPGALLQR